MAENTGKILKEVNDAPFDVSKRLQSLGFNEPLTNKGEG